MKPSTVATLLAAASVGAAVLNLRSPEETEAVALGDAPNPIPLARRDPYFVHHRRSREVKRANRARRARRGW